MEEWNIAGALARRYDGPLPMIAAVPADSSMPWPTQLQNRRSWAWTDVRRIGRLTARAGRALRQTGSSHHYRDWVRLRQELAFALRVWASYRDWTSAGTGLEKATSSPVPPLHNGR